MTSESINNLIFCGTPQFAANILEGLLKRKVPVKHVITMPDRPKGRGYRLIKPEVKIVAEQHRIPFSQPENIQAFSKHIEQINPDLILVVAYGMIFPENMVKQYLFVNLHLSMLPMYRGASPIQAALLNGDSQTGVTLFRINEGVDSGDIISFQTVELTERDTYKTVLQKCENVSIDLIHQQLLIPLSDWTFAKQDNAKASVTKKVRKEDGLVDLKRDDPLQIVRKLRAYTPWPGIYTFHKGKRIKILDASLNNRKLELITVQLEGKEAMPYQDFINGFGPLLD